MCGKYSDAGLKSTNSFSYCICIIFEDCSNCVDGFEQNRLEPMKRSRETRGCHGDASHSGKLR